ncbi:hypothetical protein [Actinoplanes sp. NPDC051411]|uniref:hypothetical protein n=1 Tax=Actinoplanes sp. NPDC051411 TaxID=3155522 RepID=UPI00342FD332
MIIDPVFVDRSGRRRRLVLIAAIAGTSVVLAVLAAMVAGFTAVGSEAVPGWPGADGHHAGAKPQPAATSSASTSRPSRAPVTAATPARHVVTAGAPASAPTRRASASATPSPSSPTGPKGRGHSPTARPSRKN